MKETQGRNAAPSQPGNLEKGSLTTSRPSIPVLLLLAFLTCLVVIGPGLAGQSPSGPLKGVKGRLDLRSWEPGRDGPVRLAGEWEFYWARQLTNEDFLRPGGAPAPLYLKAPGIWNGLGTEAGELPGQGFGTYRLKIFLPPLQDRLALRIPDAGTSMTVFVDGQKRFSSGLPGKTSTATRPSSAQGLIELDPGLPEVELILWVSNFHHRTGGAWRGIELGTVSQIRRARDLNLIFSGLIFGALAIMGLYHLFLFFWRHEERALLYFGLFCLLFAFRSLLTDEKHILDLIPHLDWSWMKRCDFLTFYLGVPFFALFLKNMFPGEAKRLPIWSIVGAGCLFSLIVILTSPVFFTKTLPAFQAVTVLGLAYGIWILLLAWKRGREGALAVLMGFGVVSAVAVNDLLVASEVINSMYLSPVGLLLFVFSLAAILAFRGALAFRLVEAQKVDLTNENKERRRAEKALMESERRFRELSEMLPETVYEMDREGRVTFANQAALETFGLQPGDLEAGLEAVEMIRAEERPAAREAMAEILAGIKRTGGREYTALRKDGTTFAAVFYSNAIVSNGQIRGIRGIAVDISQRKKLEEQLRQAQKMESLGTLAGGIAHDFNNMLGVIIGFTELALDDSGRNRPNPRALERVLKSAIRAKDLVKQILTFSRQSEVTLKPVDLNQEVLQTVNLLERTIPKMISIETRLAEGLGRIKADKGQLEQVLMNLCTNAKDAMPEGGRLVIATGNTVLDSQYCRDLPGLEPGEYVQLSVIDSGKGMDQDTVRQIFDPFFTTKEVGQGTGLGLSTVYGIVKSHQGHISCESRPGQGTTFRLYFPVIQGLEERSRAIQGLAQGNLKGNLNGRETVLLVDDEEDLRDAGKELLSRHGYWVLTAGNGDEALRVYQERDGEIDLVILDMDMPGMGGQRCLTELKRIKPGARVIIASGHPAEDLLTQAEGSSPAGFVAKPFQMEEMLATVRSVLDGES